MKIFILFFVFFLFEFQVGSTLLQAMGMFLIYLYLNEKFCFNSIRNFLLYLKWDKIEKFFGFDGGVWCIRVEAVLCFLRCLIHNLSIYLRIVFSLNLLQIITLIHFYRSISCIYTQKICIRTCTTIKSLLVVVIVNAKTSRDTVKYSTETHVPFIAFTK